jgi:hypothetical protein
MNKLRHSIGQILVILFVFCFLVPNTATAKMYKWKDDSGKTHYTDSPNKIPKKYRNKNKTDTIGSSFVPAASTKKSSSKTLSNFKIPTTGFGKPMGKNQGIGETTIGRCSNGVEESKLSRFFSLTQMDCGKNGIKRPVGDIDCKEIKEDKHNCRNKRIWVKCSAQHQCVRETPEYNRAKYKKIGKSFMEEVREERKKDNQHLGKTWAEAIKKEEKKYAKELKGKKCDDYYANLSLCKTFSCKFVHPWGGELKEKKIIGLKGGKCITTEQLPNNGKMNCALTEEMRKAISKYPAKESESAMNKVINNGQCKISGYKN